MSFQISDHVLEIERGRYNKINREQRICRQCHLNVIEDGEHFFFHCQKKNELLRKEFLTQIENLYTKLMGNNHIQNLIFFFFVSYATCCPFIQKPLALRRVYSI
jgi:hypothetical protein